MAQRMQVLLTCDLDDDDVEAVETVSFGADGATYEIELCQQHLDEYRAWIQEYVSRARRITGSRRRSRSSAPSAPKAARPSQSSSASNDVASIREWAKEHGYTVSSRGRIPFEIRSAYEAAH